MGREKIGLAHEFIWMALAKTEENYWKGMDFLVWGQGLKKIKIYMIQLFEVMCPNVSSV